MKRKRDGVEKRKGGLMGKEEERGDGRGGRWEKREGENSEEKDEENSRRGK